MVEGTRRRDQKKKFFFFDFFICSRVFGAYLKFFDDPRLQNCSRLDNINYILRKKNFGDVGNRKAKLSNKKDQTDLVSLVQNFEKKFFFLLFRVRP